MNRTLLISILLYLAVACSPPPESDLAEMGGAPPPEEYVPLPVYERKLREKVAVLSDVFELNELRRDYRRRGGRSSEILELIADRQTRLLDGVDPLGSISPEADILTADYRRIGQGQYRLQLLFRVNEEFGRDYRLYLHLHLDAGDRDFLPPPSRQHGFASWSFEPLPPTSVWDTGDLVFVSTDFPAQPIPYYLKIGFFVPGEERHGTEVDLGWRSDLEEPESSLISRIADAEDILDLYELYRRCRAADGRSPVLLSMLEERLENMISGVEACPMAPNVDLLDFRFRVMNTGLYRIYYLFKVREVLEKDYRIYLHGYVDSDYLQYLPEERRRFKFDNWTFASLPPPTRWPSGELMLITKDIAALPIPYQFKTGFYLLVGEGPGLQCELGLSELPAWPEVRTGTSADNLRSSN